MENLEKRHRLVYRQWLKYKEAHKYDYFETDFIPVSYFLKINDDSYEITNSKNDERYINKITENHKVKKFRDIEVEPDIIMCEYLDIDYREYKYGLYTYLTKDELLHALVYRMDDDFSDMVTLPIRDVCHKDYDRDLSNLIYGIISQNEEYLEECNSDFIHSIIDFLINESIYNTETIMNALAKYLYHSVTNEEIKQYRGSRIFLNSKSFKHDFLSDDYDFKSFRFEYIPSEDYDETRDFEIKIKFKSL